MGTSYRMCREAIMIVCLIHVSTIEGPWFTEDPCPCRVTYRFASVLRYWLTRVVTVQWSVIVHWTTLDVCTLQVNVYWRFCSNKDVRSNFTRMYDTELAHIYHIKWRHAHALREQRICDCITFKRVYSFHVLSKVKCYLVVSKTARKNGIQLHVHVCQ